MGAARQRRRGRRVSTAFSLDLSASVAATFASFAAASEEERDAATKAAGVIQAKLDAANEEIEKNAVILEEKDVFIKTLIQTPKGKQ